MAIPKGNGASRQRPEGTLHPLGAVSVIAQAYYGKATLSSIKLYGRNLVESLSPLPCVCLRQSS